MLDAPINAVYVWVNSDLPSTAPACKPLPAALKFCLCLKANHQREN
jgi:hypothetical protein